MSASLVGSEMCIRDSTHTDSRMNEHRYAPTHESVLTQDVVSIGHGVHRAVSYTHLTLPTICSV
eukprot:10579395-Alexandrium_andersonii.AAC.1